MHISVSKQTSPVFVFWPSLIHLIPMTLNFLICKRDENVKSTIWIGYEYQTHNQLKKGLL